MSVCVGVCRYECAVYIGGSKGVMGKFSLSLFLSLISLIFAQFSAKKPNNRLAQ